MIFVLRNVKKLLGLWKGPCLLKILACASMLWVVFQVQLWTRNTCLTCSIITLHVKGCMCLLLVQNKVEFNCSLNTIYLSVYESLLCIVLCSQNDVLWHFILGHFSSQVHIKSQLRIEVYLHFIHSEVQRNWYLILLMWCKYSAKMRYI